MTSSSSGRQFPPSTSNPTLRSIAATTRTNPVSARRIAQVFRDFSWDREFEDLERDVGYILRASRAHLGITRARSQPADSGAELGLLSQQGRLCDRQGREWSAGVSLYGPGPAFAGRQALPRYHHSRCMANQSVVFPVARLLHGRHGGSVGLRAVPALDHAQQAPLRAIHDARPWQAGQDHVLPRPDFPSSPFGRSVHRCTRESAVW
jgi:hypothetical protein